MPEISATQPEAVNSIEISRGQKGTYGWTIKLRWPMDSSVVPYERLETIDARLRRHFGSEGGDPNGD